MKIRTDFVTNSSSSSYCSIHISGSKLAEIIKKYKNLFESEDLENDDITINDNEFYFEGEGDFCGGPSDMSDMISCIIEFIRELAYRCDESKDFDKLIEEVKKNEEEINKTITSLDWSVYDSGWGGDHDSRMYHDYDEDFIRHYMGLADDAKITKSINDKFWEKVAGATSEETITWKYDGEKFEITEDFKLI